MKGLQILILSLCLAFVPSAPNSLVDRDAEQSFIDYLSNRDQKRNEIRHEREEIAEQAREKLIAIQHGSSQADKSEDEKYRLIEKAAMAIVSRLSMPSPPKIEVLIDKAVHFVMRKSMVHEYAKIKYAIKELVDKMLLVKNKYNKEEEFRKQKAKTVLREEKILIAMEEILEELAIRLNLTTLQIKKIVDISVKVLAKHLGLNRFQREELHERVTSQLRKMLNIEDTDNKDARLRRLEERIENDIEKYKLSVDQVKRIEALMVEEEAVEENLTKDEKERMLKRVYADVIDDLRAQKNEQKIKPPNLSLGRMTAINSLIRQKAIEMQLTRQELEVLGLAILTAVENLSSNVKIAQEAQTERPITLPRRHTTILTTMKRKPTKSVMTKTTTEIVMATESLTRKTLSKEVKTEGVKEKMTEKEHLDRTKPTLQTNLDRDSTTYVHNTISKTSQRTPTTHARETVPKTSQRTPTKHARETEPKTSQRTPSTHARETVPKTSQRTPTTHARETVPKTSHPTTHAHETGPKTSQPTPTKHARETVPKTSQRTSTKHALETEPKTSQWTPTTHARETEIKPSQRTPTTHARETELKTSQRTSTTHARETEIKPSQRTLTTHARETEPKISQLTPTTHARETEPKTSQQIPTMHARVTKPKGGQGTLSKENGDIVTKLAQDAAEIEGKDFAKKAAKIDAETKAEELELELERNSQDEMKLKKIQSNHEVSTPTTSHITKPISIPVKVTDTMPQTTEYTEESVTKSTKTKHVTQGVMHSVTQATEKVTMNTKKKNVIVNEITKPVTPKAAPVTHSTESEIIIRKRLDEELLEGRVLEPAKSDVTKVTQPERYVTKVTQLKTKNVRAQKSNEDLAKELKMVIENDRRHSRKNHELLPDENEMEELGPLNKNETPEDTSLEDELQLTKNKSVKKNNKKTLEDELKELLSTKYMYKKQEDELEDLNHGNSQAGIH